MTILELSLPDRLITLAWAPVGLHISVKGGGREKEERREGEKKEGKESNEP